MCTWSPSGLETTLETGLLERRWISINQGSVKWLRKMNFFRFASLQSGEHPWASGMQISAACLPLRSYAL